MEKLICPLVKLVQELSGEVSPGEAYDRVVAKNVSNKAYNVYLLSVYCSGLYRPTILLSVKDLNRDFFSILSGCLEGS